MKPKKTFAVIGLGRFGQSVVKGLIEARATVMAFDESEEQVAKVADYVNYSAVLDSTSEEQLKEAGINNADHVIVAIGNDIQASITTIVLLTELGIKNITVRAGSINLVKIYKRLGVDDVVLPEKDSGYRTALRVLHNHGCVVDYMDIGDDLSMVKINAINNKLVDKSLIQLNLREKFNINVVAIKRDKSTFIPQAQLTILKNDELLIIGKNSDIASFENYLSKK